MKGREDQGCRDNAEMRGSERVEGEGRSKAQGQDKQDVTNVTVEMEVGVALQVGLIGGPQTMCLITHARSRPLVHVPAPTRLQAARSTPPSSALGGGRGESPCCLSHWMGAHDDRLFHKSILARRV